MASKVTKATSSRKWEGKECASGRIPNRAVRGECGTVTDKIAESELKAECQNRDKEGQVRNMWVRLAGPDLYLT